MKKVLSVGGVMLCFASCGTDGTSGSDFAEAEQVGQVTEPLTAGSAVLFVVGNTNLSAGDAAIRTRLQGLGATVTVRAANAAHGADAQGKALIVISASVKPGDVNTKFRDSTVPVLCLESALFDDFRLAGPTQGTDYGTAAGQTELELLAVSHPLAVGLTVPITSAARTFSWAVPAAGAIPIARVVGSSDRMGIFAFEAGQPLTTGVAPARRVGWVATGNVPTTLTKQGWQLFDDAVNWTALAPTTIDSFAGLPNAAGDKLKSSFFLTPCLSVEAHACVTVEGACPIDGVQTDQFFPVGGEAGRTYRTTLRVTGIVSAKSYTGGTRAAGNVAPANPDDPNGIDTFYTGGTIPVTNYDVYEIIVRNPPTVAGQPSSGSEVQHYFLNSMPGVTWETHRTFPVAFTHDIDVPGGGVVQYRYADLNCHAMDNCGPGEISGECAASAGRDVPSDPGLVIPATYMGQSVSSINVRTGAAQPFHSQILHVTVTNVVPL